MIWSNAYHRTYTGKALAHGSPVWLGLVSYSLYLWHWPLLAFARYVSPGELSVGAATTIVLMSVPVAWLSYRWVETPVRRGVLFRQRLWVIPGAITLLLLMFFTGAYININDGLRSRRALAELQDIKRRLISEHQQKVCSSALTSTT